MSTQSSAFRYRLNLSLVTLFVGATLVWTALGGKSISMAVTQQKLGNATRNRVDFRRDILPLLTAHCFRCHKGADASSGYRLDMRDEILGKTNGKPLVKVGDSANSRLIHLVSGKVPGKLMPRKGKQLTGQQIDLLRAWIDQGLDWDETQLVGKTDAHWSFLPIIQPALPKVKNAEWVINPIDAFVASWHEKMKLRPVPQAARRAIIRRLYLDLIGLPPTPKEIEAFVNDTSVDAYEILVDHLLESPHYGERWARHWLDVARWAESEGYESNHLRPFAWRYRDYVVDSFNKDRPFSQFIMQQIAGDEMLPYADENVIATGFLAAARLSSNEEDKWRQRNDVLVDIVNATSGAFLGLTMNCAQCHNHKFDPITSRDYYCFQGFFIQGQPANLTLKNKELWEEYLAKRPAGYEEAYRLKWTLFEQAREKLTAKTMKEFPEKYRQALQKHPHQRTEAEERLVRVAHLKLNFGRGQIERAIASEDRKLYSELKRKLEAMEEKMIAKPQTFGFYSPVTSPTKIDVLPMAGFYPLPYEPKKLALARPYLLVGGDVHNRGFKVDVGWPAVFGPTPEKDVKERPRLALAKWLASPKNPLTARVYVNRLWQHHFGKGIVATPNDFGTKGAPPTHPKLLDWLAAEFIKSGGSTKHMHRLIVTSQTYRQSSKQMPENAGIDQENDYLWHWKPRRLEAEVIRDMMLAVSGELDKSIGGRSVPADEKTTRRSLYLLQKRDRPPQMSALFDGPSAVLESCPERHVSTVPLQALYLLNNEFAMDRAKAFAQRVSKLAGDEREKQIEHAFLLALGRRPDDAEWKMIRTFFASQHETGEATNSAALTQFCQALLNTNEFVYLE